MRDRLFKAASTAGRGSARFESPEELAAFFRECDALPGPEREPDWEDHLLVIEESRRRGATLFEPRSG